MGKKRNTEASKRNLDAKMRHIQDKLDTINGLPWQKSRNANTSDIQQGDPFSYGRRQGEAQLREQEWLEKLRTEKPPLRDYEVTMLSPDAPKPKPIHVPPKKNDADIRRDVIQWNREHRPKKNKSRKKSRES